MGRLRGPSVVHGPRGDTSKPYVVQNTKQGTAAKRTDVTTAEIILWKKKKGWRLKSRIRDPIRPFLAFLVAENPLPMQEKMR
jgi:hypothetical protein